MLHAKLETKPVWLQKNTISYIIIQQEYHSNNGQDDMPSPCITNQLQPTYAEFHG